MDPRSGTDAAGTLAPRVRRVLVWLTAIALGPPAVAAVLLTWARPADMPVAAGIGLAAALVTGIVWARRGGSRTAGWCLTLSAVIVLLGWPEIVLRAVGFRFDPGAVIQFGWPKPDHMVELDRDPELFWTLPRSQPWVNSKGFKGPEFEIPKPPGRWRAVFFGDSCTQLGIPSAVAAYLRSRPGGPRDLDTVNLGVVGYSSYQGRVLVERWTEPLAPDVGVVYFGWNDHWRAYGSTDSDKAKGALKPYADLTPLLSSSRLLQWLARRAAARTTEPMAVMRVPPEEYRDNLVRMGTVLERSGSGVLLLTAPTSYATLGVPDWIIENRFAADKESALELHREYNEVVREVAREHGWTLLDLEAEGERLRDPAEVFTKDGIHFTRAGVRWVSRAIGDSLLREFVGSGSGSPAAEDAEHVGRL